jgi:cytochrome c556
MAEEPEIETAELRERIHEEVEREGGGFLRRIALTTAVLAAFAALAALQAGDTVNEALALKTDASRLQAQASDLWAHYQAKSIKGAIARASAAAWQAAGREVPPEIAAEARQHADGEAELEHEARADEHERDQRSDEADRLLARHHRFAEAVALFQVAIALGAVAALTRLRVMWLASLLLGGAGLALFAAPFLG